jgi:hypothetical protein
VRRLEKQTYHVEELRAGIGSVEGEEYHIDRLPVREISRIPVQIKPQWIPPEAATMKGLKGRLLGGANNLLWQKKCEKRDRQSVIFSRGIR